MQESREGLKMHRSQSLGWLQRTGSHPSQSPWQRAGTPCREGTVGNPGPRKGMGYGPPFGVPGSPFSCPGSQAKLPCLALAQ